MRRTVAALSLVAILTVALVAQALFHNTVAAWIAIGVTSVICIAATLGVVPGRPGRDRSAAPGGQRRR